MVRLFPHAAPRNQAAIRRQPFMFNNFRTYLRIKGTYKHVEHHTMRDAAALHSVDYIAVGSVALVDTAGITTPHGCIAQRAPCMPPLRMLHAHYS